MGVGARLRLLVSATAARLGSRRRLLGLLALGLAPVVLVAGFWAGRGAPATAHPQSAPQALRSLTTPEPVPTPSPSAAPSPGAAPPTSAAPSPTAAPGTHYSSAVAGHLIVGRLVVSSINVNMAIEAVATTPQGSMDIPVNPNDAGWWQPGYGPGDDGHVVLDGHVNWYTGPGPFRDLHKLHPGDLASLAWGNGQTYTYSVTDSKTYPWNASVPGVFGPASQSTLVLITCAGTWDAAHHRYTQRLIVEAQIIA